MKLVHTIKELQSELDALRNIGKTIGRLVGRRRGGSPFRREWEKLFANKKAVRISFGRLLFLGRLAARYEAVISS